MRHFPTGAIRDSNDGKLDYECLSPLFLRRFAEFMLRHRVQADGEARSADNWKLGMPSQEFFKSELRHLMDVWLEMDGFEGREDIEEACCAMFFNLQGFMHERLKEQYFAAKREGKVRKRVNLNNLVRQSKAVKITHPCWVQALTGDIKRYIDMLEVETKKGSPPVFRRVSEILLSEFGMSTTPGSVRNHFAGVCTCEKLKRRRARKK